MTNEKKGGMTVQEAGRLGGAKVVKKYGSGHMATIGTKGGKASPTKFAAGESRTSRIASKGGKASGGNFANDPKRASEAGRLGGAAKQRNAAAKRAAAAPATEETPPA